MTAIWNATGVTPAATNRLPVDVSSSGGASRVTMQQLADLGVLVGESHNALGTISSGTNDIDLSLGGFVSATIGGALTFTFSNPPASPNGCEWVLVLTNGGSAVVTWPGSVTWVGGTAPTLQASGIDVLRFYTVDGGTSWIGELAFDESGFLSPSDIASGTITPRADDIDLSGGTDGDVLTVQADGSLALETPAGGGAGTKTLAVFAPGHNQPPASAYATFDTRNSALVLDFDDATDESAVFVGVIPEGAVLTSGIIASVRWMATTATSGNVRWRVAFERGNTDLDSDSFDTATEATGATNGTSGIATTTEIAATNIDSLVAGDTFRVRITRVGTDGTNDNMSGDAELRGLELRAV